MIQHFFLGVDTSKGYADFHFCDQAGTRLPASQRYDDTPAGHAAVRSCCLALLQHHPKAELTVGLEASGGLERNWLRCFTDLLPADRGHVYQLNPLAVKRYLERELHRNITDPLSARGIAEYLREGLRPADRPFDPSLEGPRALYHFIGNTLDRRAQLQNELHSLLPRVHPDLVAFCRDGFPEWTLRVLARYPTVDALKRAHSATVARIPYVTTERATSLIEAAKQSVASVRDPHTAIVITRLAKEILRHNDEVEDLKQRVIRELGEDPEVRILASIPGIGLWTAIILRLEYRSFTRFHSEAAAVAYAGLNPCRKQSGDREGEVHISRRGRKQIRRALYMAAVSAIRCNPAIQAFYTRLRRAGKEHMVALTACMGKLVRLAYACVQSGKPFDPDRYRQIQERHRQRALAESAPSEGAAGAAGAAEETGSAKGAAPEVGALSAPVSRREARRRKAAAAPQAGVPQQERGRGAALVQHDTGTITFCQPSSRSSKTS